MNGKGMKPKAGYNQKKFENNYEQINWSKKKMDVKGEHEDLIYKNHKFIGELQRVQDLYFDTLFEELKGDGFCEGFKDEEEAKNFLFDYVFNEDVDTDLTFGEWLDKFLGKNS